MPIVVAIVATFGTACGGGDDAPADFTVSGAWVRPTPSGATSAAVYLTVIPDVDDVITGVDVSPDIAADATLHTSTVESGDEVESGVAMVTMTPIDSVDLTAGEPFEFSPGADHIMLTDLAEPLTAGDHFTLTIELGSGRNPSVDVTVADEQPDNS